jgi:ABC-2 type transport system permease protein
LNGRPTLIFLKFRAIGPHSLTKRQLKDLVRSGWIKGSSATSAVTSAYSLTHTKAASVQIIADASDTNTGSTVAFYAGNVIRSYQDELLEQTKLPYRILLEAQMAYNPQLQSAFNFVPGVMVLVLILLCAMLTAVAIVKEKEMGTMELILVSPVRPWMMIVAKAVPFLVVGLINVAIILTMAYTAIPNDSRERFFSA